MKFFLILMFFINDIFITYGVSFGQTTYSGSVEEDKPAGTVVPITMTLSGARGALSYSLIGTSEFSIHPSTGILSTVTVLDYEKSPSHGPFIVEVSDGSGVATAAITVFVIDTNVNSPECRPLVYAVDIMENSPPGTEVVTLNCIDLDGDDITYSITKGDDITRKFSITSGVIQTTASMLDYEKKYFYDLSVSMSDGENTNTAKVYVTVNPVNEFDPTWEPWTPEYASPTDPFYIDEDVAIGTRVLAMAASDADSSSSEDGMLIYSLVSVSPTSGLKMFQVDSASGELVTISTLDCDGPSGVMTFDLNVKAADLSGRSIARAVRIVINDINDNAPQFSPNQYIVKVTEGHVEGTAVVKLTATDLDATSNSLSYTIQSGDRSNNFVMNGDVLEVINPIDLDAPIFDPLTYMLTIEVKDAGSPPRIGQATVTVMVVSNNEYAPVFGKTVPTTPVSISESAPVGYSVARITASDNDFGPDGEITYSLTGGDGGNYFLLDDETGVLRLQTGVDYESLNTNPLSVQITASDRATVPKAVTLNLEVTITDYNDNTPTCEESSYVTKIDETAAIGTMVQRISCSDRDAGDTLTYTILSGNTNNDLMISTQADGTGVIATANTLNCDGISATLAYDLEVEVSDGLHTVTFPVTVAVNPVNEATPTFFPANKVVAVPEDATIGSVLVVYTAVDADSPPHGVVKYEALSVSSLAGSGTVKPSTLTVDSRSGRITLARKLDHEYIQSYQLVITATDGGGLVGTGTVTVSVTDVNDNEPQCAPVTQGITEAEAGATVPEVLVSLSCMDADLTLSHSTLSYSLTQSPGSGDFGIDDTGAISVLTQLDYELVEAYGLEVHITDGVYTSTVPISVMVAPVNEHLPVFAMPSVTKVLAEDVPVGTSVVTMTATDADATTHPHGRLRYSLVSGNDAGMFQVDQKTGVVRTVAGLDRETQDSYTLVIQALDEAGELSSSATVLVEVSDVNDNIPDCTNTIISSTFHENTTVPYVVHSMDCSDLDLSSSLTFTLTSGDPAVFRVVSNKLEIYGQVDWDIGPRAYDVSVTVSDGDNKVMVSGKVTILPVNEHPPVFTEAGQYTVSVPEDAPTGSVLVTLTALDEDSDDNSHGQVSYKITSGGSSKLQMDSYTGVIKLASSLDRETTPSYSLSVEATDGIHTATATVSIAVTDVNDNRPVFQPTSYQASISESNGPGNLLVTVTATDADDSTASNNGKVTYAIIDGDPGGMFSIDSTSGQLRSSKQLDYESQISYSLVIVAKDSNGEAGALSATAAVTVQVMPFNEYTPVFSASTYTQLVSESASISCSVGQVAALDQDAGQDGQVYYKMLNHPKFYLDSETGIVYLKAELDYETARSYSLEVTAEDKGDPSLTGTCTFNIEVTDENDNSPDCTPNTYVKSLREDAAVGEVIATLSCTDPDTGPAGILTYSIESVNKIKGPGSFAVSENSGVITLARSLDFEVDNSYDIEVKVNDQEGSPIPTIVKVSVQVTNVNEHAPSFLGQPRGMNVPENVAMGTSITTLRAKDEDRNDEVTYSMEDPSAQYFHIQSESGSITVHSQLDYEVTSIMELTVVAVDSGTVDSSLSSTHTFTVTITDVNDNVPRFTPSSYTATVSEHSPLGTSVITVTATDQDSGEFGKVTYRVLTGNTGHVFRMDTDVVTGEGYVMVDDASFLDYETLQRYELQIEAVDGGGNIGNASVIINVEPYNDHPPQFTPTNIYTYTLYEDTEKGTSIGQINATDFDMGYDGMVEFYLLSSDSPVQVDFASGILTLASDLDRETLSSHVIHLLAVDKGVDPGPLSGTGTLSITVLDVNDNAPECSPSTYTAEILDTVAAGTFITQLTCQDKDGGPSNNVFTYAIDGLEGQGQFVVGAQTGRVEVADKASLNADIKSNFRVVVAVTDKGTPPLSSSVTVFVTVKAGLSFDSPTYTGSVEEDLPVGSTVTVAMTVTGASGTLTYSISGTSEFSIDPSTGEILTATVLDYETATSHGPFTVTVDDGVSTASSDVTVFVIDTNLNGPECDPMLYTASVPENSPAAFSVATLSCSDADGDVIIYSITAGDDVIPKFHLPDNTMGSIETTSAVLDYETSTSYVLDVSMSDGENMNKAKVYVTVTPMNEFTPAWDTWNPTYTGPTVPYYVDEDVAIGTSVLSMAATDDDSPASDDGILVYSLVSSLPTSGLSFFQVDSGSGTLVTISHLDCDGASASLTYDLEVKVADLSGLSTTRTVRVTVNDVNDNSPVFSSSHYVASITEGDPTGTSVIQVTATDADATDNTVTYSIISGNTNNHFLMNADVIEVMTPVDLDDPGTGPTTFTLVVRAADSGTPANTGQTVVSVTVVTNNEHAPVFGTTLPLGSISIPETAPVGYSVATVTATDTDYGQDGVVSYSITGGDTDGHFLLDPVTGVLTLQSLVDYEALTSNPLSLQVMASDGTNTAVLNLDVTVTDSNDNVPSCDQTSYISSVNEDVAIGTSVKQMSCTDEDAGTTLTFTFLSGNTNNDLQVDATGAIITLNDLDYDGPSPTLTYNLEVRVSDGTYYVDISVTLSVKGVNEFTPVFTPVSQTFTANEDVSIGSVLGTFTALDEDSYPHNINGYTITALTALSGSGSALDDTFTLDSNTGQIRVAKPLDYEVVTAYQLMVVATDRGGLVGTGTVTVSVVDINDNDPICNPAPYNLQVPENSATLPEVLVSLSCMDADLTLSHSTLSYSLTQSPGSGDFSADDTGVVSVLNTLDFETVDHYDLEVSVTDGTHTSTVYISVAVTAVNEGPPVFTPPYTETLPEDATIGTSVKRVTATDVDAPTHKHGKLYYSIESGNVGGKFQIDSMTGLVKTVGLLDRETLDTYNLEIQATEEEGTNTATTTLTITITDVNDNLPTCINNIISASVSEDVTVPYTVASLDCSDVDQSSTLSFILKTGDPLVFTMNGPDLQIIGPLDWDLGPRDYDITVSVSDGQQYLDVSGKVTVRAVNEHAPTFTSSGLYTVSVPEDTTTGSVLVTVTAIDDDSADNSHGQVSYRIISGGISKFQMVSSTGDIKLVSALDRETISKYDVEVEATDGMHTATATVSITVTDVNDNRPVFTSTTYNAQVSESVSSGYLVMTLTAYDADDNATDANGKLVYSIEGGDPTGAFSIDPISGAVTMAATLDYETQTSYSLTVVAKDKNGGIGALSSSTVVSIQVTGVNEHTPVFSASTYTQSVSESESISSSVGQVAASDQDAGIDGQVYYTMPNHPQFYLDSETGIVYLKASLDYESEQSFDLSITVQDRGTPVLSSSCVLTIEVLDENDNSPECNPSTFVKNAREDIVPGGPVVSLSCSDADAGLAGTLTYAISSVNGVPGSGDFDIDDLGIVTFAGTLDYETDRSYDIEIVVDDSIGAPEPAVVQISLLITDVNEYAPSFQSQPTGTNKAENVALGTTVVTLVATDQDIDDTVTYSFATPSKYFFIEQTTGRIVVQSALDYETDPFIELLVVATDSGKVNSSLSSTHTFTVTVIDTNDFVPVFTPSSYIGFVSESSAAGSTILTVTAIDNDAGTAGTVTYNIMDGNTGNVFRIETNIATGEGFVVVDDASFLDYEVVQRYELWIEAVDGGGNSGNASVVINVEPYNDHPPQFTSTNAYSFTVYEDVAIGTQIVQVSASDEDLGLDGEVEYRVITANNLFQVDFTSGNITVASALDRETSAVQIVKILAVDYGQLPGKKSSTGTLSVTILDVNDNTPTCIPIIYMAEISEDSAVGTSVVSLTCIDNDDDPAGVNNQISFSLLGPQGIGSFVVDASTGQVNVAGTAALDAETQSSYELLVSVTDGGSPKLSSTAVVYVTLTGINEDAPEFSSDPVTASTPEDAALNSVITTITATDPDIGRDGDFYFSITAGNTANMFQVDSRSGDIILTGKLDREVLDTYTLVVTAIDYGTNPGPLSSSATVVITVTDVNDHAPVCSTNFQVEELEENSPTGTSVFIPLCTDADDAINSTMSYRIDSGNVGTAFSVDADSGEVFVHTPSALDAETSPVFILELVVSDGGSQALSTTVTLQVDLTDQNEAAPQFQPSSTYNAFVDESAQLGDIIINVTAVDTDLGTNGQVRYAITAGNDGNAFYMNTLTGGVIVQNDLDRETFPSYTLTVSAHDLGNPSLSSEATLIINVNDFNDNAPVCASGPYDVTTPEDTKPGTLLMTLKCSDADLGVNADIRYHITAGDSNSNFVLDPQSGKLRLAIAVDYESIRWYQLNIEASDMGTPSLTGTTQVTVFVTAFNEHSPVIVEPPGGYTASIPEDMPLGEPVLHMTATDEDLTVHGDIRWSITGGNKKGHFAIDENTGNISVVYPLDREDTVTFILVVRATDSLAGSAEERYTETDVVITVTDVNDNMPLFIPGAYVVSVLEGAAVGSLLATVTVRDDDEGVNTEYDISVIGGDIGGIFTVSDNSVYLNGDVDHDVIPLYTLHLKATDRGTPPLSSTAYLIINVLSENEFPPVFVDSNTTVTLKENIPVGAVIFDANATDADIGQAGELCYAIESGDPTGSNFLINPISGKVITGSAMDYDTLPQEYYLIITATDMAGEAGALTASMTLTVKLEDVNDITPVFTKNTFTTSVREDVTEGEVILAVNASDGDSGVNGEVKYSIVSGDEAGLFDINTMTGEITAGVGHNLDYESQRGHTLLVKVEDKGTPTRSSSCIVSITVIDVNDNVPQFSPSNLMVSVDENNPHISLVTSIAASDADSNNNALINFYIDGDTDPEQHFFINKVSPNNAEIYTKAILDREYIDKYILHILAIDAGVPRQTGTGTVTVIVKDTNDFVPEMQDLPYETSVFEDIALGTTVHNIRATDEDMGVFGQLTYSLVSGDRGDFYIVPETGAIRTVQALDRENYRVYKMVVEAKEVGSPFRAVSATATVSVLDVNDNAPQFLSEAFRFYVQENVDNKTWVGRASATDADTGENSVLLYSIKQTIQGPPNHFYIDPATGDIHTGTSRLDREQNDLYVLFVQAKDGGSPSLYSETKVYIVITDHNDNVPRCQNSVAVSIPENTLPGLVIANLTVTDQDIGPNSALKYTVIDPDHNRAQAFFDVNQNNAELILTYPPDREVDPEFQFLVRIEDRGTPVLFSSCEVTVTVVDENDNPPMFGPTFYCVDMAHNAEAGTPILYVTTSDADEEGSNSVVMYELADEMKEFYIGLYTGNISKLMTDDLHPFKKYVFNVTARDAGVPSLSSENPAVVRVDTFQPSTVVIVIALSVPYKKFGSYRQKKFLKELEETLRTPYPLGVVKMWKVEPRKSQVICTTSNRRRLLQTESDTEDYAVAYVYAVANSETYEERALEDGKSFVIGEELLSIWQQDEVTKEPTETLAGSRFETYGIVSVEPYIEPSHTPWVKTTAGILTIIFVCLAGLLLLAGLIALCCYCCCRNNSDDDENRPNKFMHGNPPVISPEKILPADRYYNDKGLWHSSRNNTGPTQRDHQTPPPSYRNSPGSERLGYSSDDGESRFTSSYGSKSSSTFHH